MVADDPESFADLDGHQASQGRDAAPSCAANGQGASGAPATNGCGPSQAAEVAAGVANGINNFVNHAYDAIIATLKDPLAPISAAIDFADTGVKAYETSASRDALASQFGSLSTQDKVAVVTEALMIGGLAGAANTSSPKEAITTSPATSNVPESIPAGPNPRPTAAQQGAINEMGEAHGCHTCGTRSPGTKSGNWVGDHNPPTALNKSGASQVYKPQCLACSRQQGGQVAAAVRASRQSVVPQ